MMGFSGREILLSVLYAFIFGLGYSLFYQLILISFETLKSLPRLAREILGSEKIFPSPSIKKEIKDRKFGAVFAFFSVFLFFVGFLLLSYLALDGQLRLYMLIISSASFYIFNSAFFVVLSNAFILLFDCLIFIFSTALRIIILPFRRLVLTVKNKKTHNN